MKNETSQTLEKQRQWSTFWAPWLLLTVLSVGCLPISNSQAQTTAEPALGGTCPVCLVEMGKEIPGDPRFQVEKDGHSYLFPGIEQKTMFEKDPVKYIPVAHGACPVCMIEMGENIPGKPEFATHFDGRLFLFATEDQKRMFDDNPEKYRKAVIAADGLCVVCLTGGARVEGKREFQEWYDGMLYRFPSDEIRRQFLEHPDKYVPAANGTCLVCRVEMQKDILGKAEHAMLVDEKLYFFAGLDQMRMFKENPNRYLAAETSAGGATQSPAATSPAQRPAAGSATQKTKPRPKAGGSGSSR